jgi:Family of unknown function (DUF6506)
MRGAYREHGSAVHRSAAATSARGEQVMGTKRSSPLLEGLILIEAGADSSKDRLVRDNGRVRKTIVFVAEPAAGPGIAIELVEQGIELIELDGGFGSLWAARIFEAIGGRVPVGFVAYGIESMEAVAAFKQRYEAQVT